MTWPPPGTKPLTQVFCLPGSKRASLSIFPDDGPGGSVLLDRDQIVQTRDALNTALARLAPETDA